MTSQQAATFVPRKSTGEPEFIEKMSLQYHDQAVAAGVTILHAAVSLSSLFKSKLPVSPRIIHSMNLYNQAFDSVPCDLGVLEMKRALLERGATPSSIEVFFRLNTESSFASKKRPLIMLITGIYGRLSLMLSFT